MLGMLPLKVTVSAMSPPTPAASKEYGEITLTDAVGR
jgi:hypothetical protein